MNSQSNTDLPPDVQARIDFVRSVVPKRKPHPIIGISVATLVIAVIVGLVLLLGGSGSKTPKAGAKKPNAPAIAALSSSTPTTSYTSQLFGLGLSYPTNWSLKDSGKGLLTLTSPLTTLSSDSGDKVTGEVTLTIEQPGHLPSGLSAGTDLAVLDSTIVPYSNPTTSQPAQTYISFVQYSTTNIVGGLDGVYLTGNLGYQKDQVIPSSDIAGMSPLIFIGFGQCATKACKTYEPLTIASTSWSGSDLGQIIDSIIGSFVFNQG